MKKLMLTFGAAMLWCASALAMLPVEGVYEKTDDNGNVLARMQVWDAKGSLGREGQSWNNPTNYPYIGIQVFEGDAEVAQIGTSYYRENDTVGSAAAAIVLDKQECQAVNNSQEVVGIRKRSVASFGWQSEDVVNVKSSYGDSRIAGTYHRTNRLREIPAAVLMYGYEYNRNKQDFFKDAAKTSLSYKFYPMHGPFSLQCFNIKDKKFNVEMTFYAENDFNLIMEKHAFDNNEYYFPFIHDKMLDRTEETWGNYKVEGTFTEAAAMVTARKLLQGYSGLVPKGNACLRFVDFFSGEGENAVSTHAFEIKDRRYHPEHMLTLGKAYTSEDGSFMVKKYVGPTTVNGTEIRFREGPYLNSLVLGAMVNGEKVSCLGYEVGDGYVWAYVKRSNGAMGYMAMQYLKGVEQP